MFDVSSGFKTVSSDNTTYPWLMVLMPVVKGVDATNDVIGAINLADINTLSLGTYGTETQATDENGNLVYNKKTDDYFYKGV